MSDSRFAMLFAVTAFALLTAGPSGAEELCFTESSWNGFNGSVDCFLQPFEHAWVGYSTTGEPCHSGEQCGDTGFAWTLSRSDTDPYVNTGSLSGDTTILYLWAACIPGTQLRAVEFGFAGDLTVDSFTPVVPYIPSEEIDTAFALAVCQSEPLVVAEVVIRGTNAVERSSWGSLRAAYR